MGMFDFFRSILKYSKGILGQVIKIYLLTKEDLLQFSEMYFSKFQKNPGKSKNFNVQLGIYCITQTHVN